MEIIYALGGNVDMRTWIDYTNTHVSNYIKHKNPDYKEKYSRLYINECCLRRSIQHLNIWQAEIAKCYRENSTEFTEWYSQRADEYPQWDRKTPIYMVESNDGYEKLLDVEVGIANSLYHLYNLQEALINLTIELCKVSPLLMPIVNEIINGGQKKMVSNVGFALGRVYLEDYKIAKPTSESKNIKDQLVRLARWRNDRTHKLYLFAHVKDIDGKLEIEFSDSLNNLSHKSSLSFTSKDFSESVYRFFDFINWWCSKMEHWIKSDNPRNWAPQY